MTRHNERTSRPGSGSWQPARNDQSALIALPPPALQSPPRRMRTRCATATATSLVGTQRQSGGRGHCASAKLS
jgi:hypothetical protein